MNTRWRVSSFVPRHWGRISKLSELLPEHDPPNGTSRHDATILRVQDEPSHRRRSSGVQYVDGEARRAWGLADVCRRLAGKDSVISHVGQNKLGNERMVQLGESS